MSWRALTISDVRLTPQEKAAMEAIQGSNAIGAVIVTNVIGEFRDTIEAAGTAVSSDATKLPDLVRIHAINRVRWQWLCEFPQLKALQTEAREKLNTAAEEMLAKISSRDVKVPPGDGSAANQSPTPSFGTRGGTRTDDPAVREFTKCKQDGI